MDEQAPHRLEALGMEALAMAPLGKMDDRLRELVIELCRDAIAGRLSLDAFYARWPDTAKSELLDEIYDDLEDGVEHYPGHWWSGKPLSNEWRASEQYRRLALDAILLSHRKPESVLADCRSRLIEIAEGKDGRELERAVAECVESAESERA